jgi:hypothetical protein
VPPTDRKNPPSEEGGYRIVFMTRLQIWLRGIVAAAISGAAGGVLTGFAAVGIDPQHFNLQAGIGATFRIGAAAALINAVIGVAAYLQKSPLPTE